MPQNIVAVVALTNGISAWHTLLRFVIVWTQLPFCNGQNLQLFLRNLVIVQFCKNELIFQTQSLTVLLPIVKIKIEFYYPILILNAQTLYIVKSTHFWSSKALKNGVINSIENRSIFVLITNLNRDHKSLRAIAARCLLQRIFLDICLSIMGSRKRFQMKQL